MCKQWQSLLAEMPEVKTFQRSMEDLLATAKREDVTYVVVKVEDFERLVNRPQTITE